MITNAITKYESVEFYIWLTKDEKDFRSETKRLTFKENKDPNGAMTEEEINGINKLLNEIEELKNKIQNIEGNGEDISNSDIWIGSDSQYETVINNGTITSQTICFITDEDVKEEEVNIVQSGNELFIYAGVTVTQNGNELEVR